MNQTLTRYVLTSRTTTLQDVTVKNRLRLLSPIPENWSNKNKPNTWSLISYIPFSPFEPIHQHYCTMQIWTTEFTFRRTSTRQYGFRLEKQNHQWQLCVCREKVKSCFARCLINSTIHKWTVPNKPESHIVSISRVKNQSFDDKWTTKRKYL